MIVVSDTTPFNYLILTETVHVLPAIFGRVYGRSARALEVQVETRSLRKELNSWSGWPQEIKETGTGGVKFLAQRSVTATPDFHLIMVGLSEQCAKQQGYWTPPQRSARAFHSEDDSGRVDVTTEATFSRGGWFSTCSTEAWAAECFLPRTRTFWRSSGSLRKRCELAGCGRALTV